MTLTSLYPDSFESFSIKEHGVELSSKEKFKIKNQLNCLEQRVPAACKISLVFKRNNESGDKLKAELSIRGGHYKFNSKLSGSDALILYRDLEKDIDEQLRVWKKDRFKINGERPLRYEAFKYAGGL